MNVLEENRKSLLDLQYIVEDKFIIAHHREKVTDWAMVIYYGKLFSNFPKKIIENDLVDDCSYFLPETFYGKGLFYSVEKVNKEYFIKIVSPYLLYSNTKPVETYVIGSRKYHKYIRHGRFEFYVKTLSGFDCWFREVIY
jgi:hypothetical protein